MNPSVSRHLSGASHDILDVGESRVDSRRKQLALLVALTMAVVPDLHAGGPVVSNIRAKQRDDSKQVDIYYNVSDPDSSSLWVTLSISSNNAASYTVSANTVTNGGSVKSIGAGVPPGENRHIVWNAAADWNGQYSSDMRFRITAEDTAPTTADYLVIDLSAGPSATSYPVTNLSAVPGGEWTDEYKTTKLVLRRLPAGTFTMGSPTNELGRFSDETQHQVTLTQPFYIGVFEVSQRQWERVMGTWPSYFSNTTHRETRPVERISYYEIREVPTNDDDPAVDWPTNSEVNANSFMGRLRAKTQLATFDLPTEAQWEYACRAGTTTALNSGENITSWANCPNMSQMGRYWFNGGAGYTQDSDPSHGTAKCGSYQPNAWGLYDMHGNVYERCLDWAGTYAGTVTDPRGPTSPPRYNQRVMRGGDWDSQGARYCRSASRSNHYVDFQASVIGFRVVATEQTATHVPSGMVLIHGGTNSGTDPDFGAYNLSVTSFYMDKYEVAKALWDDVKAWSVTNGYNYRHVGLGKGVNHPVHTVDWYDCVTWCNARSQKAGLAPVYYRDSALTQLYKGGMITPYVDSAANGYRLPSHTEWACATRGGAVNRRFPWNDTDTIQHSRANYFSDNAYDYDTSPTRGYHPSYNTGTTPYTSPVGSFAPNGYGLYDMAGNVYEWCWWTRTDAKILCSGGWNTQPENCRNGYWYANAIPGAANNHIGFRTVSSANP